MKQNILDRICKITNDINELLSQREELIINLQNIEKKINIYYEIIYELKDILELSDKTENKEDL